MIIEAVQQYQPELILLSLAEVGMPARTAVLPSGYRRAFVDAANQFWIHRNAAEPVSEPIGNRSVAIEAIKRVGDKPPTEPDRRPGTLAESTVVPMSQLSSPYALARGALRR